MASIYLQQEANTDRFTLEDGSGFLLLESISTDFNRRIRRENLKRKTAPLEIRIRAYAKPQ